MNRSRKRSWLSSMLVGAVVFGWTTAGETSNAHLSPRELPKEIAGDCRNSTCAVEEFRSNWAGRTSRGDLFIVGHKSCATNDCQHWLVEKNKSATRVLLEVRGSFRLSRSGTAGRYPTVDVRTRAEDSVMQTRFEWNGEIYQQTDTQRFYRVNGVECGTREQCRDAAERALNAKQVDRAVKIWKKVHGVSWI